MITSLLSIAQGAATSAEFTIPAGVVDRVFLVDADGDGVPFRSEATVQRKGSGNQFQSEAWLDFWHPSAEIQGPGTFRVVRGAGVAVGVDRDNGTSSALLVGANGLTLGGQALTASQKASARAGMNADKGPVSYVTNLPGLKRWYSAVADAEREPARLWWCGNSVMDGVSTDTTTTPSDADMDTYAAASVLRNKFAREFAANAGFVVPAADTRWVDTGTQTDSINNTVVGPSGGKATVMQSGATKTLTTPHKCTTLRIHYYGTTGLGAFTYAIDGGTAVPVNTALVSPANYAYVELTGLTDDTHTVVITATSNNVYFCGLEGHSGRGVVVGKFGWSGKGLRDTYGDGVNSTGASAGGQQRAKLGFAMGAPDCVVIGFVRNDWKGQNTKAYSTAQYTADLTQIYDYVASAGGCVLIVGEPDDMDSNNETGASYGPVSLDEYQEAARAWALTKPHAAFVWLKDFFGTWAVADADGFYRNSPGSTDPIHPGRIGQQKMGRLCHTILSNTVPVLAE